MRAVGIIAEFDPFHDGHAYLIREAKRLTGADFVVVAMSGDFAQRGEPAIFDKYERAKTAVMGGADAVFEIPAAFATSGARVFSEAGVKMLAATGVVDSICFGSESGDIELMETASKLLDEESDEFRGILSDNLRSGDSYPKAREKALLDMGVDASITELIKQPNNILGIHYLSAIRTCGIKMDAVTVKRKGAGYHEFSSTDRTGSEEAGASDKTGFESATGIRNRILNEGLTSYGKYPVEADDFTGILFSKLLDMSAEDLSGVADMTLDLSRAVIKHREKAMTFKELIGEVKSKNNLYTQVSRALMHVVLGITDRARGKSGELRIPYLRLLAFSKASSELLRRISDCSDCEFVTKPSDSKNRNDELFKIDMKAASLYNGVLLSKYGVRLPEDIKRGPMIV